MSGNYYAKSNVHKSPSKAPFTHNYSESSISQGEEQINSILKNLYAKHSDCDAHLNELTSEKNEVISQLNAIGQRMTDIKTQIHQKKSLKDHYERTLHEGETAFRKISESTKTLMLVIKKEKDDLGRRVN